MTMKYMLDTDTCIYVIKNKPESVRKRFEKLAVSELGMSLITYGELLYGSYKSKFKKEAISMLEELQHLIPCLPMSETVAGHYGKLRATLEKTGNLIGNNDLWIAAHALSLKLTLITNNEKEFSRVPGLKIANWVK